jgi:hypothetical protein
MYRTPGVATQVTPSTEIAERNLPPMRECAAAPRIA